MKKVNKLIVLALVSGMAFACGKHSSKSGSAIQPNAGTIPGETPAPSKPVPAPAPLPSPAPAPLPVPPGPVPPAPLPSPAPAPIPGPIKGLGLWYWHGSKAADVGAKWYYNWSPWENNSGSIEYVPMIWQGCCDSSRDAANQANIDHVKNSSATTLLGFNEPDHGDQGNMSVSDAIYYWPKLMETGKRLGSPAVAGDYNWLDSFMSQAKQNNYRVDFIAVHTYPPATDDGIAATKTLLTGLHAKYNKPIWLTEFGICNWSNTGWVSDGQIRSFVLGMSSMLDGLPFVERYSWFSDRSNPDCSQSATFDNSGNLTVTGQAFKDAK